MLVSTLAIRFSSENQTEIYRVQLKSRTRRRGESLPELAQAIRRLTREAYPDAPLELQETIACDHFKDALRDMDLKLKLHQSHPKSLDEATRIAVGVEAFQIAESQKGDVVLG